MPVNNGFITAPVTSPKDVEQALGYNVGGDVGVACSNRRVTGRNPDGTFILGTGNINKWAKYKPVRYKYPYHADGNWYRGDDWKCGLIFAFDRNPYGYPIYVLYQSNSNFAYAPPRNNTDWFRLADFNGYDHNAEIPLKTGVKRGAVESVVCYENYENKIRFGVSGTTRNNNLRLSDFGLGALYLTVEIFNMGVRLEMIKSKNVFSDQGDGLDYVLPTSMLEQELDVYYSLTNSDGYVFTLPWDDDNYYHRRIRTLIRRRYYRAIGLYTDNYWGWIDLTVNSGNLHGNASCRLKFQVALVPQPITFDNRRTFFKTEVRNTAAAQTYTTRGVLTSETGYNVPDAVTIPSGTEGVGYVYYEFPGFYSPASSGVDEYAFCSISITYDGGSTWNMVDSFSVKTR